MALPAPITPFSGTVDVCSLADQADDLISKHCILTEHERTAIVLFGHFLHLATTTTVFFLD